MADNAAELLAEQKRTNALLEKIASKPRAPTAWEALRDWWRAESARRGY